MNRAPHPSAPAAPNSSSSSTTAGHKRQITHADLMATFRRGTGPMYQPHPHHLQQQQQHPQNAQQAALAAQQLGLQQQQQTRQNDAARAKAQQPTDRNIPEELAEVVVGDGVERYEKLRAVERKLDATMMRKRLDVTDNMTQRYTRREGVLRVWVSNTAEGQPWQVMEEGLALGDDGTIDFGDASGATFRVKIEGRLLEDEDKLLGDAASKEKKDSQQQQQQTHEDGESREREERSKTARRPRLSHFFKSIKIDFHRNPALQPDGYSAIEWQKPAPGPNFDANSNEVSFDTLEFERKGDENINITISMVRDEKNERFKLSPQLAEILDTDEEDKVGAIHGIWDYCRAMGLQEDEDRRSIVCDEPLRKLFQRDKMYFPHISDLLIPHLKPLPPVQLDYTIRVDKPYIDGTDNTTPPTPPSEATIYDLRIPLLNPLNPLLHRFHQNHQSNPQHLKNLHQITSLDSDLALLVQKIHHTNAKRKFYENLAKDPVGFVKRWTSSQRRDLEVVLAEERNLGTEGTPGGLMTEGWRKGGEDSVWGSTVAKESVGLWLARMGKGNY